MAQTISYDVVVSRDATIGATLSCLPIGFIFYSISPVAEDGILPCDGSLVSRTTYSSLWTYANKLVSNGVTISDTTWTAKKTSATMNVPYFSQGDGSTTFRLPLIQDNVLNGGTNASAGKWYIKAFGATTNVNNVDVTSLVTNKVSKSGDTMTGVLKSTYASGSWLNGISGNAVLNANYTGFGAIISAPTKDGRISLSTYPSSNDIVYLGYMKNSTIQNSTNALDYVLSWDGASGALVNTGTITGTKVFNAVYNDYAELFPRTPNDKNKLEVGDIIALDMDSNIESYTLASLDNRNSVVGVYSGEYAHLIGGDTPPTGVDFIEYNKDKYIPVALAGRVHVKVIGKANKGDYIVADGFHKGVGRVYDPKKDYSYNIIGMLVESDNITDNTTVRKLKIKIR